MEILARYRRLIVSAALLAAFFIPASARTRVGEVVPVFLESPHPLVGPWRGEIAVPGAALLKVSLHTSELGSSDVLRVLGAGGEEVFRQAGGIRSGEWLPSVGGDRLTIEILPAPESHPWGILIEEAAAGDRELLAGVPESICLNDDRKNAACYDAAKQAAGDAIGRMAFAEGGTFYLCTGELISDQNHFLTNNHCVSTQAGATSLEVWWRYQYSQCDGGTAQKESLSRGSTLLATDPTLDYTLLQITSDTPAQRYGYLTIDPTEPVKGEVIWIPQHSYGTPKTFAVLSDMDGPDPQHPAQATIRLASVAGNAPDTDIGYYADTQGGSSGSPVLRADNTVVALHHWGTAFGPCTSTDMNQGIKMSLIYPQISSYLENCTVSCAAVPPQGVYTGVQAAFTATATGTSCTGAPTFSWDFGDGAQSSQQNPIHTYAAKGSFTWVLTVQWAQATCTRSGAIVVRPPGDCDGDGEVSIGEVQKAINMFLGLTPPACGVDCDGGGEVSIGEVQKVINGFLGLPASC